MSVWIDLGMAALSGLALYIMTPMFVTALAHRYPIPYPRRDSGGRTPLTVRWRPLDLRGARDVITDIYSKHAMLILGDALFELRGGRILLRPMQYVTDLSMGGIYRTNRGGEDGYYVDPDGMAGTWHRTIVGFAHAERNQIFNLRWAIVAERFDELVRTGEWEYNGLRKAYFALEPGRRLVDAAKTVWAIQEDAGPRLGEEIDRLVEIENSFYDTYKQRFVQTMEWITLFGAGIGGMFLARKLAGTLDTSGGGGGEIVPFMIGVFL